MFNADINHAFFLDAKDELSSLRELFCIPTTELDLETVYLCGNSLGLQPKSVRDYLDTELEAWDNLAVEGHFSGENPWMYYHKMFAEPVSKLVGAKPEEVVIMNNLTTNLHLMMVSFYQPTHTRYKIIMEGGAFPSDQYAMETQVKFHGYNPDNAIIEINHREGEYYLRTEDILQTIDNHKDEVALIMMGGVNYYTGQAFDMKSITEKGHQIGALVGFDLAHAAGNIKLELHDWNVDFAVWCTYKYLNSGPGGTSGVFVHEKHGKNPSLNRFAGWWGHDEESRFQMKKGFIPMEGAQGWQLSNAQIFPMAIHKASLDIFNQVGMDKLVAKSNLLTGYLCDLFNDRISKGDNKYSFKIITPENPNDRGCQISILTGEHGKQQFKKLQENGIIADWREPNVIRVAPVPLYNTFLDVYKFIDVLFE